MKCNKYQFIVFPGNANKRSKKDDDDEDNKDEDGDNADSVDNDAEVRWKKKASKCKLVFILS